jgi:uncharacterized membrane protein YfcA
MEPGIYHLLVTLPDRLYPFAVEIEGRRVRGMRAYQRALARAYRKHGHGHFGFKLTLYRSIFHILGSIAVVALGIFLSEQIFNSHTALYMIFAALSLFITFQEFYLQRRIYQQLWRKGILDWCAWIVPLMLYVLLLHS